MNAIFTLEEIGLRDAPWVGEEAASLGEILKFGAPVLPAFIIPVASYAEYLNFPSIKTILTESNLSDPEELKRQLLVISLPPIFERSLRASYRTLSGPQDTFVAIRAKTNSQKALGEEEVVEAVKKLWIEHLTQLWVFKENFSQNPLPLLVQQIEWSERGGKLFTSDPFNSDPATVVVEVEHKDGKERIFLEKGTTRLQKRIVTGADEEETPLEFVTSLSSWATKIERLLNHPQELGWSAYRKDFSFSSIRPLYLLRKTPATAKLWVQIHHKDEVIPSEAAGLIVPDASNATFLAREFPTKPVLLALNTVNANELAIVREAKHREKQDNLHLILPPVRTVNGLSGLKRALAGEGLPRGSQLKYYFRISFPANAVLISRFLEVGIDGAVFDTKNLIRGFLGTEEIVTADDSLLWAINEVQRSCKDAGVNLLYLADPIHEELLAYLLKGGLTHFIVDVSKKKDLLTTLAALEEKIWKESAHV